MTEFLPGQLKLKAWREKHGISQKELADQLEARQASVCDWESKPGAAPQTWKIREALRIRAAIEHIDWEPPTTRKFIEKQKKHRAIDEA